MNTVSRTYIVTLGLAIFSMLIGAGNLIFPLFSGMQAGCQTPIAMLGFFITAIFLPVLGLITMILFDGNYDLFFKRLGVIAGNFFIVGCMITLGPVICLPRIVSLSHEMIAPFIPWGTLQTITPMSSFIFSLIFLGATFLATCRKTKIVEILGNVISPVLIVSLAFIFFKGVWSAQSTACNAQPAIDVFKSNILLGYQTLDLIGALFYASIVLTLLKKTLHPDTLKNSRTLALICLKASVIGATLLGLVYVGMATIGAFHGHGFMDMNAAELFREVSFKILSSQGAAIIAIATIFACISTAIAIGAVLAEYVRTVIFKRHIGFPLALAMVLIASIPLSVGGFEQVSAITSGPITYIGYPLLITITICNLMYKLFDFQSIKVPVAATFIVALISYLS